MPVPVGSEPVSGLLVGGPRVEADLVEGGDRSDHRADVLLALERVEDVGGVDVDEVDLTLEQRLREGVVVLVGAVDDLVDGGFGTGPMGIADHPDELTDLVLGDRERAAPDARDVLVALRRARIRAVGAVPLLDLLVDVLGQDVEVHVGPLARVQARRAERVELDVRLVDEPHVAVDQREVALRDVGVVALVQVHRVRDVLGGHRFAVGPDVPVADRVREGHVVGAGLDLGREAGLGVEVDVEVDQHVVLGGPEVEVERRVAGHRVQRRRLTRATPREGHLLVGRGAGVATGLLGHRDLRTRTAGDRPDD